MMCSRPSEVTLSSRAARMCGPALVELVSRREFLERSRAQGVARGGGRERARQGGVCWVERGGAETSVRSSHRS